MPRMAATAKRQRGPIHGSYRPETPPSEIARTPVLFRLPEVHPSAASEAKREVDEESHRSPAPLHSPPEPPLVEGPLRADQSPSMVQAAASSIAPPPPVASVAAASPVATEKEISPLEEPDRSWWDHWSSGVILILLIIALVTASIIAFSDNADPDPGLLVGGQGRSESVNGKFHLNEIEIPDVKEPMDAELVVAQTTSPVVAGDSKATSARVQGPTANASRTDWAPEETLASTSRGDAKQVAGAGSTLGANTADTPPNSGAEQPAGESLIFDSLDFAGKPASEQSTTWSPGVAATSSSGFELATPATGSPAGVDLVGQSTALPSEKDPASITTSAPSVPIGQLPAQAFPELPDISALAESLADAEVSLPSAAATIPNSASGPTLTSSTPNAVSTNLPSYTTLLGASGERQASTGFSPAVEMSGQTAYRPASTVTQGTATGTSQPAEPQQANASSMPQRPLQTTTPESDADALIRAFRSFSQMTEAEAGGNLYLDRIHQ
jgi:hypothetical protein